MTDKNTTDPNLMISAALPAIAKRLEEAFQQLTGIRVGFALMAFTGDRAQYVSNIAQEDLGSNLNDLLNSWKEEHKTQQRKLDS